MRLFWWWMRRRWLRVADERAFLNWAELHYPEYMQITIEIPTALWTARSDLRKTVEDIQSQFPSVRLVTICSSLLCRRVARDRKAFDLQVPGLTQRSPKQRGGRCE